MMLAAEIGLVEGVRVLLNAGAESNAADKDGNNALHCATRNDWVQIVKDLVKSGALLEPRGWHGQTPLLQAAEGCCLGTVSELLALGADAMARDEDGMTALMLAACWKACEDKYESDYDSEDEREGQTNNEDFMLLIKELEAAARGSGRLQELFDARSSSDGSTALLVALANGGSLPSVVHLLALGSDIFAVKDNGDNSLHCAIKGGNPGMVELVAGLAPGLAVLKTKGGRAPAATALSRCNGSLANCVNPVPTIKLLKLVPLGGQDGAPLIARVLSSHLPLTDNEWEAVPLNCPGLGPVLPAALAHSEAQAGRVVRCMCAADKQRLHVLALTLGRVQRAHRLSLPAPVVKDWLSMFDH